ncbi:helix-turn-helix domain-containing protein [Siphonobacter aquaeclarae]|jgi:transposase|uniref:Transposase n=1 Tax=Siphonobacter aquaeclarae TaxID=563176 RepID=A0A1G9UFJ0_9BACT|nr:helix-turn-helix domain-containing protein [Siphonobacter aquaeclarae]MBO9636528.1 helix-turn-helix domain-containing protein [Siphonobacter aquaeclarae]SDM58702.1 Transposase [Siphonobacter aquaeclarae]
MRFIQLTDEERAQLARLAKRSPNANVRKRSQCILLSSKGVSTTVLMQVFAVSRITLYHWFDKWEEKRYNGLVNQSGQGRKGKLVRVPVDCLEKIVAQNKNNLVKTLKDIQANYGITCHTITLRRHLQRTRLR